MLGCGGQDSGSVGPQGKSNGPAVKLELQKVIKVIS